MTVGEIEELVDLVDQSLWVCPEEIVQEDSDRVEPEPGSQRQLRIDGLGVE